MEKKKKSYWIPQMFVPSVSCPMPIDTLSYTPSPCGAEFSLPPKPCPSLIPPQTPSKLYICFFLHAFLPTSSNSADIFSYNLSIKQTHKFIQCDCLRCLWKAKTNLTFPPFLSSSRHPGTFPSFCSSSHRPGTFPPFLSSAILPLGHYHGTTPLAIALVPSQLSSLLPITMVPSHLTSLLLITLVHSHLSLFFPSHRYIFIFLLFFPPPWYIPTFSLSVAPSFPGTYQYFNNQPSFSHFSHGRFPYIFSPRTIFFTTRLWQRPIAGAKLRSAHAPPTGLM